MAVRNIRREAMDKAKAMKKAGELTEDSQKTMEEDVQKLTDKYIKNIDDCGGRKAEGDHVCLICADAIDWRCRALKKSARHFC